MDQLLQACADVRRARAAVGEAVWLIDDCPVPAHHGWSADRGRVHGRRVHGHVSRRWGQGEEILCSAGHAVPIDEDGRTGVNRRVFTAMNRDEIRHSGCPMWHAFD